MTISEGLALSGKVALITGAATGIGRASALLFAGAGARVALVDVSGFELERTAADVRAAGGEVTSAMIDLARPEDCAVAAAVRAFGRLDVLLNNAGVGTMVGGGTVESIALEHWDLAQDVNVRAIYLVSRAAGCARSITRPALRRPAAAHRHGGGPGRGGQEPRAPEPAPPGGLSGAGPAFGRPARYRPLPPVIRPSLAVGLCP